MGLLKAALVLVLFASVVPAQRVNSEIIGTVKDPSGGVLPGAVLKLEHLETGIVRTTESDASGSYALLGLPPGDYRLQVEFPGFRTVVNRVTLSVSENAVRDVVLLVGATDVQVVVISNLSVLEQATGHLSGVVSEKTLQDLPLNGRDLFQLTMLQPGVTPSSSAGPNPWSDGGVTKAAVQGARPSMNNVTLDGGDINDPGFNIPPGGVTGTQMGVEGIQEFRVQLNSYAAEYGRNAGAHVQFITKSGTNQFHGSLFEFHRNAALDARNFFDSGRIPPFVRNQFGAALGGPVVKNRSFFFLNFEGLVERRSVTSSFTVPDQQARLGRLPSAGDESRLTDVGVNPRVSPLLALFPLPNGPSIGGGLALVQTSDKQPTRGDYGLLRFDHQLTSRQQVFGRYVLDDSAATVPFMSTYVKGFPGKRRSRNQYLLLSWQQLFTNRLQNETKLGLNRTHYRADAGTKGPVSISLVPDRPLGPINITGLPAIGHNFIYPIGSTSNTFELIDNFSNERGKHTLKFGANIKRMQINGPFDLFKNGSYVFTDLTVFGLPAQSSNPALEFFLRGIPFLYFGVDPQLSDSTRGFRQTYSGFYLQDDWRVASSLMLNFGLRWEYWSNPGEAHNRLSNFHNVRTDTKPTPGRIWQSVPADLWSPRLGFAWSPDARTVIRGGAGIVRDQIWSNLYFDVRFYEPFYRPLLYLLPDFQTPPGNINGLIGFGGPPQTIGSFGITYTPDFPYFVQSNLNVQRELRPDLLLQAAYAGSRGNHLVRSGEANPFIPALGRSLNPNTGPLPLIATDAQSSYNSGQLLLRKQPGSGSGLFFQVAYTFSKAIDDQSGAFPSDYVNESGTAQDFYNRKGDRARASFDRKHVLVTNYLYDVPLPGNSPATRGWRVGGIYTWMSGLPFTANLGSFNNSGTRAPTPADRPNLKPNVKPCGDSQPARPDKWFDTTMFTLPAPGEFGNAGRNIMCGPGLNSFDFSIIKETRLSERTRLEFRSEVFNLFNHANFDVPVNTQGPNGSGGNGDAVFIGSRPNCNPSSDTAGCGIPAPNAGRIFRTVTTARQIQFGMKLIF